MPHFALRLNKHDPITVDDVRTSFYWLTNDSSSFTTGLDPNLRSLGAVTALNVDFVRIAVAVYAADRTTYRSGGGSDWNQREIDLAVPVSNAAAWTDVASELKGVLDFLTGDRWSLSFNEEQVSATSAVSTDESETGRRSGLSS